MTLALYLDEDIPVALALALRTLGHDVLTTRDAGRRGAPDDDQLAFAADAGRTIYSQNIRDYERLSIAWANDGRPHSGIVVSKEASISEMRTWFIELDELYPSGVTNLYLVLPFTAK